ncbi:MAG: insulinase family protein [Planctomycetes bacterium]|nr:insulinase family protein [Planctomycetota bacterium]
MRELTVRTSQRLDEALHEATLDDGLPVVVVPKPGYLKSVALLTTRYGAVDQAFRLGGEVRTTPAGIAHFLEHKLFEDQAGDVFDQFARVGAAANAYTTHHETGYYFATSERFPECLDLLLDFVTDPYFTQEQIEKERQVIAQEIRMYLDDADARAHQNLLRGLYHRHPVREEVPGTLESIQAIDKPLLELCHGAFYRPEDMLLVVAGDLAPADVFAQLEASAARRRERRGAPPAAGAPVRLPVEEPAAVVEARVEERQPVASPRVLVGWKDAPVEAGPDLLRRSLVQGLLLELLFGRSTAFYEAHYASGLIDGSFSHGWMGGRSGYAYSVVGGETRDPEAFVDAVLARAREARAGGLDGDDFARMRNRAYGSFVRSWNSVEQVVSQVTSARLNGWDVLAYVEAVEAVRHDDLAAGLDLLLDDARRVVSVVRPLG